MRFWGRSAAAPAQSPRDCRPARPSVLARPPRLRDSDRMDREALQELLRAVGEGRLTTEAALERIALAPLRPASVGGTVIARLDTHRSLLREEPEVILCSGKTVEQVCAVAHALTEAGHRFLATRVDEGTAQALGQVVAGLEYYAAARIAAGPTQSGRRSRNGTGMIEVVSGGTSDIPVAEEAAVTAELLGHPVGRLYDVGVAGLHRLLAYVERLRAASVLIVVAGMEGALPSVVAGLVACPVIAVPTSVGYGASFAGLSALLAMLSSCSPGVVTVNIDNGFGAGYAAARINARADAVVDPACEAAGLPPEGRAQ